MTGLELRRRLRYYYLRFIRLRGNPHELALGMALGIFSGMMPILPFQTAFAVALAMIFKGSKITAALGTWVSNPANWYFLYYYSYQLGAVFFGLKGEGGSFAHIMAAIRSGEAPMAIIGKITAAGGLMAASFLVGGLIMGIAAAVPSYFLFLTLFRRIRLWREGRIKRRQKAAATAGRTLQ